MALMITAACINCDVCAPACPNDAIYQGEVIYEINPLLCTECVGHHEEKQCVTLCPVECIPVNPEYIENHAQLHARYLSLTSQTKTKEP